MGGRTMAVDSTATPSSESERTDTEEGDPLVRRAKDIMTSENFVPRTEFDRDAD